MIEILLNELASCHFKQKFEAMRECLSIISEITPIGVVQIRPNTFIERIRNNYNGEIFSSKNEISYRKDLHNITEFGRANIPYTSIFYGSLSSSYINEIRVVNVLETNKEFRFSKPIKKRQIFTSGRWRTIYPLTLALFSFNREAALNNLEVLNDSIQLSKLFSALPYSQRKAFVESNTFLSNFFTMKSIRSHLDYSLTAFFSDIILEKMPIDGILYPSVRAGYRTYNIALKPSVVEFKTQFEIAAMFELFAYKKSTVITNVAIADIDGYGSFSWNYEKKENQTIVEKLLQ